MLVLAINSGSSSLKCAVIDPDDGATHFTALAQNLGTTEVQLTVQSPLDPTASTKRDLAVEGATHDAALAAVLGELEKLGSIWSRLAGVGHRVVHGGERFSASCVIDDAIIEAIEDCAPLAPLHNPANLLGIIAAREALPQLPHVAVFDTAFHQSMPEMAYRYAVPASWYREHQVRRYGFHGTSHRFVSQLAAETLSRDPQETSVVVAHLGNGCSLAAVEGGKSVDTTMGLTPLEGLVMGTRSGDLDPAIVFYMQERGLTSAEVNTALNKQSGLLGLSENSNDMRTLTEAAEADPRAQLAIDVFCHRLVKHLAAMATNLKRLDALVFTGGIGEHSPLIRSKTCERLGLLGVELDTQKNQASETTISSSSSRCAVLVLPTNEELLIARDTRAAALDHFT